MGKIPSGNSLVSLISDIFTLYCLMKELVKNKVPDPGGHLYIVVVK